MDNADNRRPKFTVSQYKLQRPGKPVEYRTKLEFRQSFTGKKLRRFFPDGASGEAEAWLVGRQMTEQIIQRGVRSVQEEGTTIKAAVARFLPRVEGSSKSHREKTKKVCDYLVEKYGAAKIQHIGPEQIEALMLARAPNATSRAVWFRYLRMFFRWAERFGLVDKSPMAPLDCPPSKPRRNILTPDQMRDLIEIPMQPHVLASVLLGGFAGLRTAEICRMKWEDINTETGQIHIRPGVQKDSGGFDERIVDFTPPLTRRVEQLKGSGLIIPARFKSDNAVRRERMLHEARRAVAKALEWKEWPPNCLRHSFATYHLALCKNPGLTAFQMGHTSPAMVQRVYAVPAVRADQVSWWDI